MRKEVGISRGSVLKLAIGAMGAAIYAVLILPLIAVNLGPLGIANLRPAIIIPMTIASVFGPSPSFLCAAFGNSIADIIVYGADPGTIPGFLGSGLGALVTGEIAQVASRRFTGTGRLVVVVLGFALGLGWVAGLVVGIGNLVMGFVPTLEAAFIVAALIGIGNTIFACTILPPVEVAVRKFARARSFIEH